MLKKKIWANFQRIIELFTQNIVTKQSKIWVWDPEKKPIPDPGSRVQGQKGTGSRIRIRNTEIQFCRYCNQNVWVVNMHVADPDLLGRWIRIEINQTWKIHVWQTFMFPLEEFRVLVLPSFIEVSEDTVYSV